MIVYIAGRITGVEDAKTSFAWASKQINKTLNIALNPMCIPYGLTQGAYMDICFAMIRASDACYFMEGYEKSEGAIAEFHYAKKIGKKLFFDINSIIDK